MADPFSVTGLRRRVIDAWRDSPARLRADALLEADFATVGYRDRVVVELAQNAADAAAKVDRPGRLMLRLTGDRLEAANTGSALDAAGVESISVARASAKTGQPDAVGRFGVGFASVLSITDAPEIHSTSGSVRWSRPDAEALVAEELGARDRHGPPLAVLRLPFAAAGVPLEGYDTDVVLPLRDAAARDLVVQQLAELDATLLLALPALREIEIVIDGVPRVLSVDSQGDRVLLRDGSVESRWAVTASMTAWGRITWAVPVDTDDRVLALPASVRRAVRAPTLSDDPLTIGAVLIAPYPLDVTRRRVTPGPEADAVTEAAADLLVDVMAELPPDPTLARLVPTGLPDGGVDASLRAALTRQLTERAWLPIASEEGIRQRPRDAVVVDDALVGVLAGVVPSVLPAGWPDAAVLPLGAQRLSTDDLVERLAGLHHEPAWWRALYAALEIAVPAGAGRDALGALPVPLADGTTVTGPRGVTVAVDGTPAVDLSPLGLRVVDPAAAHPLLLALGATEGTAAGLLEQPRARAAVEESYDSADPEPIAVAVLSLVAVVDPAPGELPWLAELALPDSAGDWRPAGELLLPGGRMAAVVAADSPFGLVDAEWVQRWGPSVLMATGVLDGPAVVHETDAVGPAHDLDDEAGWWDTLPAGSAVAEVVAVRDLELVSAAAWPAALELLADPDVRGAVVDPAVVLLPDGGRSRVPSYSAWWLRRHPVVGGELPSRWRLAAADPLLAPLYDEAPTGSGTDPDLLAAIGVLVEVDDADPADVLERLADPARFVTRSQLRAWNAWLAGTSPGPAPTRLRAVRAGEVIVVDADQAVVVDAPDLLPLLGDRAVVPVAAGAAADLADRLDLPLAGELADFDVVSTGATEGDVVVHDRLEVRDADGVVREVAWRLVDDVLHVDRRRYPYGLGRGRAWRDGEWPQRHRRTEALTDLVGGRITDDEDDLDECDD
jgi:hypothetical protein